MLLTLRLLRRNGLVVFAIVILVAFLLMAAFAPLFTPYDPYHQDLDIALQDPNLAHPFGTDRLGRDLLSRVKQDILRVTPCKIRMEETVYGNYMNILECWNFRLKTMKTEGKSFTQSS